MVYDRESLEKTELHDLRKIGKKIGVRAPTRLKKADLVENILAVQSGKVQPYFSAIGRPSMKNTLTVKKQKRSVEQIVRMVVDEFFEQEKEQMYKRLIKIIKALDV